jgi:hypothetical protein
MFTLRQVLNQKKDIKLAATRLGFSNLRLSNEGIGLFHLVVDEADKQKTLHSEWQLDMWLQHLLRCMIRVTVAPPCKSSPFFKMIASTSIDNEEGLVNLFGKPLSKVYLEKVEPSFTVQDYHYTLPDIKRAIYGKKVDVSEFASILKKALAACEKPYEASSNEDEPEDNFRKRPS